MAMRKALELALLNYSEQFLVECNASSSHVGGSLMQERPVAFFNQRMGLH